MLIPAGCLFWTHDGEGFCQFLFSLANPMASVARVSILLNQMLHVVPELIRNGQMRPRV